MTEFTRDEVLRMHERLTAWQMGRSSYGSPMAFLPFNYKELFKREGLEEPEVK